MAQLVKLLILDFGSGHGLMVSGFEPRIRLCLHCQRADSLSHLGSSVSLSLCPSPAHSLSFSQNENHEINNNEIMK